MVSSPRFGLDSRAEAMNNDPEVIQDPKLDYAQTKVLIVDDNFFNSLAVIHLLQ